MALYDVYVNTHTRMIPAPEGFEGEPLPEIDSEITGTLKHRMTLEREIVRYVGMHMFVCACVCMRMCKCVFCYTCTHKHIYTYSHAHLHVYKYAHAYTCTHLYTYTTP
jgi:hypothetical protein